ncbi:MAG: ribosome silencing factor [Deltaproteobacteria bacterium]|nr:ribosome silencing factor [Deltaproteobacteria bacterium]
MIPEKASKNHKQEPDIQTWQRCVKALQQKKVLDLMVLDVCGIASFTDTFIIASGRSSRQVSAVGEHVIYSLKKQGIRPLGVEGLKGGQWVLIDYGDVVIHIFFEPTREFYDLEGLWSDAKRINPEES